MPVLTSRWACFAVGWPQELDAALHRGLHRSNGFQQRGLAGPVGADHGHDLALVHVDADIVQGTDAAVVDVDVF